MITLAHQEHLINSTKVLLILLIPMKTVFVFTVTVFSQCVMYSSEVVYIIFEPAKD